MAADYLNGWYFFFLSFSFFFLIYLLIHFFGGELFGWGLCDDE